LRLQWTVRVAAWWMLAQGTLYLLLGVQLAVRFRLRFDHASEPYLRLLALTLVCLGFFLVKALRDPRRQYLAVDILILYMLGHVYFLLDYRLQSYTLTPFEWFGGVMDLLLGASLVLHRTRSTKMEGAGSLLSAPALDLARETGGWMTQGKPAPKATLGDLEAPPPPAEGGGSSEVIPHMD
jgi:hypothetical protein